MSLQSLQDQISALTARGIDCSYEKQQMGKLAEDMLREVGWERSSAAKEAAFSGVQLTVFYEDGTIIFVNIGLTLAWDHFPVHAMQRNPLLKDLIGEVRFQ